MRSISRLPLSQTLCTDKFSEVCVCARDEHASSGARVVPFSNRDAQPGDLGMNRKSTIARSLESRQAGFEPSMGGFGWMEHCPKCDHAFLHGWSAANAMNAEHSSACRARLEGELANTAKGRERIGRTKDRF